MTVSNDRPSSVFKKSARPASAVAETLEPRRLMSANTSDITTPTNWHWYQGVSATFLANAVSSQSARIVDLKVQTTSPLTFNAALVKNSGAYSSGWWWYYGQTAAQVANDVTVNHARIVSLDPYVVNGKVLFATLLVPNTGASAKSWWYYIGETPTSITAHVNANKGRLVDLEPYTLNGKTFYADVMVSNTGSDAKNWHWYYNATPSTISSLLKTNDSRLVDLNSEGNGKFDVIMQKNDGVQWFWYYGVSASKLSNLASQNGARIFDLDSYSSGGSTVFSAVMVNNSNAIETTVGNILRGANSTAVSGAYLRQVDGPVIADVNGERQFEPASAIKIVAAATALLAVKAGKAHLTDSITYYYNPADPTNPGVNPDAYAHTPANALKTSLQNAIKQMLQVSDNRLTFAIEQRFGLAALNSTAQSLGMTSTIWNQTVGNGVPGNYLTLADAGLIYDKIADGTLLGTSLTNTLMGLILNQTNYGLGGFIPVVKQEAAKALGVALNAPAAVALANKFIAQMLWGSKGGGYSLSIAGSSTTYSLISTAAGYLELPTKTSAGTVYRKYAYGVFVDYATVPIVLKGVDNPPVDKIGAAENSAVQEMVRGIIASALKTWI
ncbi:MAG: hypothetical protein JWM97_1927 [Phycisphaerales bacterium]|nr:hypothetical protein [Phycisphaerales bacterium]